MGQDLPVSRGPIRLADRKHRVALRFHIRPDHHWAYTSHTRVDAPGTPRTIIRLHCFWAMCAENVGKPRHKYATHVTPGGPPKAKGAQALADPLLAFGSGPMFESGRMTILSRPRAAGRNQHDPPPPPQVEKRQLNPAMARIPSTRRRPATRVGGFCQAVPVQVPGQDAHHDQDAHLWITRACRGYAHKCGLRIYICRCAVRFGIRAPNQS